MKLKLKIWKKYYEYSYKSGLMLPKMKHVRKTKKNI